MIPKDEETNYLANDPLLKELESYIDKVRTSVFCDTQPSPSKLDTISKRSRDTEIKIIELCRSLTHRKVHLPVKSPQTSKLDTIFSDESDDESDTNSEKHKVATDQILNQIKVIHLFWQFCLGKLYEIVDTFVDKFAHDAVQLVGTTAKGTSYKELWFSNYRKYKAVMDLLEPLFDYVPTNYRRWLKHIVPPEDITILEYADSILVLRLKAKLGDKFLVIIEEFLDEVRAMDMETLLNENASHFPFRILYKFGNLHNVTVSSADSSSDTHNNNNNNNNNDQSFSFKEFYLESLRAYTAKHIDTLIQPVDVYAILNVFVRKMTCISLLVSPEVVVEGNDIVLQEVLMNETAIRKYFKLRMAESDETVTTTEPQNYVDPLRNMFQLAHDTFKERGQEERYSAITAAILIEQILRNQPYMSRRHGYRDIFFLIISLYKLICFNTAEKLAVNTALSKIMGGNLKVLEYYVKFCEDLVQHTDPEDPKYHTDGFTPSRCHYAFILNRLIDIGPEFLPLLSKAIFRRFIMRGPLAMNGYSTRKSYEYSLYEEFMSEYSGTNECQQFSALINELLESIRVSQLFSTSRPYTEPRQMEPVCIARANVPQVFQNDAQFNSNSNSNSEIHLRLPDELQRQWNQFLEFYRGETRNGDVKRLTPAYHLQHCEVSTPFKLPPNGETLLLELTLHQTLVIGTFNDNETVSFDQILKQTGINETSLSLALKSFTNVGLLRRSGTTYRFNPEYQPDLRKVVHNKIRIPLPKSSGSSSSSSGSTARTSDRNDTITTAEHTEGLRSNWKRELLCACIVRSLKGLPSPGLTRGELVRVVQTQIRGFSVGEFREALAVCLRDGYVAVGDGGMYSYA